MSHSIVILSIFDGEHFIFKIELVDTDTNVQVLKDSALFQQLIEFRDAQGWKSPGTPRFPCPLWFLFLHRYLFEGNFFRHDLCDKNM